MRKLIVILLALWVFGTIQGCGTAKLEPKTHVDFGAVSEGEIVTCLFTVLNETERPIGVSNVFTSCGCTDVVFEKDIFQPGQYTDINVRFDTRGRQGFQRSSATVRFEGKTESQLLVLEGFICGPINETYAVGVLQHPSTVKVLTVPICETAKSIKELKFDSSKLMVTGEISAANAITHAIILRVSPSTDFAPGPFHEEIQIVTDDVHHSTKLVQVTGARPFVIEASAETLILESTPGCGKSGEFEVLSQVPGLEITNITHPLEMQADVRVASPTRQTITICLADFKHRGVYSSEIAILAKAGTTERTINVKVVAWYDSEGSAR